jgi:hypothetical protein
MGGFVAGYRNLSLVVLGIAILYHKFHARPQALPYNPAEHLSMLTGFRDPEDLVVIPIGKDGFLPLQHHREPGDLSTSGHTSLVLASSMTLDSSQTNDTGIRAFFSYSVHEKEGDKKVVPFVLWPRKEHYIKDNMNEGVPMFGERKCKSAPIPSRTSKGQDLMVHGIGGRTLSKTTFLLAAVFHAPRESVEYFVVELHGDPSKELREEDVTVRWEGCHLLEEGVRVGNDVDLSQDGEFVFVTNYMPSFTSKLKSMYYSVKGILDIPTGDILFRRLRYDSKEDSDWQTFRNFSAPNPNGILLLSHPENGTRYLFYAQSSVPRVCRIRLPEKEQDWTTTDNAVHQDCVYTKGYHVDNLHFDANRGVIVSGAHVGMVNLIGCLFFSYTNGYPYCPSRWGAVWVDPWSLTFYTNPLPQENDIGAIASVAVDATNRCFYYGSLMSDRIAVYCPHS